MEEFKNFGKLLTVVSSNIINAYFRTPISVERKSDGSPVTIADQKVEEAMRNLITKFYPDHGILGEEFAEHNPGAEYQWVIDPIDGTNSFICGVPLFGTMIALLNLGTPVMGILHFPVLNQTLTGDGNITVLNDREVRVGKCSGLSSAVLATTDHSNIEKYQNIKNFSKLIEKVKLYRTWGDCYGYFLLATGYIHIMIDPIMEPWDSLPLIPIITGAGGVITDYCGNDPL